MNLQHRNQAPRPQNRHRFDFERKSLKKPEAPGSAGRCEKGTGRSTAPSLCPATLFHPSRCSYPRLFQRRETRCFSAGKDGCCAPEGFSGSEPQARFCTRGRIWFLRAWNGSFPHPGEKPASQALTGQRNSVLFRRKRRVLRTRGFLTDQATGLVLHTGRNRRGLGSCCWVQKSRCLGLPGSGLLIA